MHDSRLISNNQSFMEKMKNEFYSNNLEIKAVSKFEVPHGR